MKGTNWKYHWHIVKEQLDMAEATIKRLERKIKKYENNNIRSTRNRKNNNTTKSSRRVYTKRSAA
tara:strand:+ start:336 stop:530 length:195 start_codon:yes stop_codon:yes gene_type:complete